MAKRLILNLFVALTLIVGTVAPAYAAISCTISGNGSDSSSFCDFDYEREVEVEQENKLDVENKIEVDANTGGNEAEDNTGGEVWMETGEADVKVGVATTGNSNAAQVAGTDSGMDY